MKDISKFLYVGITVVVIIFAIFWFSNTNKNTLEPKKETKITSDQSMQRSNSYPKSPKKFSSFNGKTGRKS